MQQIPFQSHSSTSQEAAYSNLHQKEKQKEAIASYVQAFGEIGRTGAEIASIYELPLVPCLRDSRNCDVTTFLKIPGKGKFKDASGNV